MGDIRVDTWDEFLVRIKELYATPPKDVLPGSYVSELLFRGQSDARWRLETTLERWAGADVKLTKYYADIRATQHEIESRTGMNWNLPDRDEYVDAISDYDHFFQRPGELYEYLVYLRHNGFPSPLLDWTASPFVAAYFAFRSAEPDREVAIFGYREWAGIGKSILGGAPEVHGLGPHVRTHHRHYLQQSQYTVCVQGSGTDRKYVSHESVLSEQNDAQDLLWKFVLPGTERRAALEYLHRHNITAYSLLNSDEALMESLAIRQYVLGPDGETPT